MGGLSLGGLSLGGLSLLGPALDVPVLRALPLRGLWLRSLLSLGLPSLGLVSRLGRRLSPGAPFPLGPSAVPGLFGSFLSGAVDLRLGVGSSRRSLRLEVVGLAYPVALARPDAAPLVARVLPVDAPVSVALLASLGFPGFAPVLVSRFDPFALRRFFPVVPGRLGFPVPALFRRLLIRRLLLHRFPVRRLPVRRFPVRRLPFLVSVLGHRFSREKLSGLGVSRRLTPAVFVPGRLDVAVVFPSLVATAAGLVLVRVVGAHTDPPAITRADTGHCRPRVLNSGDGSGVSERPTRVSGRYRRRAAATPLTPPSVRLPRRA